MGCFCVNQAFESGLQFIAPLDRNMKSSLCIPEVWRRRGDSSSDSEESVPSVGAGRQGVSSAVILTVPVRRIFARSLVCSGGVGIIQEGHCWSLRGVVG